MPRAKMPDHVQRNFRVAELGRIFRSKYRGLRLPDDDAGRGDLKELLFAHASSPRCTQAHLRKIADDWAAPEFDEISIDKLINAVLGTPLRYRRRKAETIGKSIRLRFEERELLGIRTIRCIDKTQAEIKAIRHERKMDWQRANRREEGVMSRAAYLASFANSINETKPWLALDMSKASWYRKGKPTGPLKAAA
jgi:hypothetical protein